MDLLSLKREIESLPDIKKDLDHLHDNWFKRASSPKSSFWPDLPEKKKAEMQKVIKELKVSFPSLSDASLLNDKLHSYIRNLVELKLTSLRGDERRSKMITDHLLYDDYHSLTRIIEELRDLTKHSDSLSSNYDHINSLLKEELDLEGSLHFFDASHQRSLHNIRKTLHLQKKIVADLGKVFLKIAKEEVRKRKR